MEKCQNVVVNYEPSDSIEKQGKRSDIQKYLNNGYYVKEDRNGYWVLVRSSKLHVTVSNSLETKTFNMKDDVLNLYSRQRISDTLVEKFKQDINSGKVNIYMDVDGNYEIILI